MKIRISRDTTVGELCDALDSLEHQYGDDSASITIFGDLSGHVEIHGAIHTIDRTIMFEVDCGELDV
jgi:hypothetical protein